MAGWARPATRLIGRDADLRDLDARLDDARLVTVLGPPGTGKTRLAVELAARRADGGGVAWCVDVTSARNADDVVAATRAAVGAGARGDVGAVLADSGAALLVIDNVEQVAAATAASVGEWLAVAPQLRVLVTSREPLHVAGEVVFELRPLAVDDAVELFIARAHEVVRDFAPTGDERARIADIVRRLDGIPLAIEFAARRLRVLGLDGVAARLSKRFELLTGRQRDAAARHATLRDAIEWSWRLLDGAERAACAQLSIFRGGAPLAAVEAVLQIEGRAPLDVIEALVDRSLVRPLVDGDAARYTMYESIREFAEERLGDERASAHARHAAWFARDDVAGERANRLAAHERAVAAGDADTAARLALVLDPILASSGPSLQQVPVLDAALALDPAPPLRARLLAARGRAHWLRQHLDDAQRDLEDAIALANALGEGRVAAAALCDRAGMHLMAWQPREATACLDRAAAEGDEPILRRTVDQRAFVAYLDGDFDAAERHWREALHLAQRAGDARTEGYVLHNLGALRLAVGRLDEAAELMERSRDVQPDRAIMFGPYTHLGLIAQERGDYDAAQRHFERALGLLRAVGDRPFAGQVTAYMAGLSLERGDVATARERCEAAVAALHDAPPHERVRSLAHAMLGTLECIAGRVDAARTAFADARRALEPIRDPRIPVAIGLHEAQMAVARARGETDPARVDALRREASDVLASAADWCARSDDVRFAYRMLARQLERDALVVAGDASWFRVPDGDRVDLSDRPVLRPLIAALADARERAAGTPVPVEALIAAVWPGEELLADSGVNRLKFALTQLRNKYGLGKRLVHKQSGYLIDPAVPVRRI